MKRTNVKIIYIGLVAVMLFLAASPLVAKINFPQNDDWVYYRMVGNFLQGNFALDPISAPTFYTQGFLATVFSLILGFNHLPFLTLAVSIGSFVILERILARFYKLPFFYALLLSLLFFVCPLQAYSALGFMTEGYFVFFLLLSIYLYYNQKQNQSKLSFAFYYISLFALVMVKQAGLFLPLGICLFEAITVKTNAEGLKTHKTIIPLLRHLLATTILFLFYFLIFPKTPEMIQKGMQFHHLYDFDLSFSIAYGMLLITAAFLTPLFLFTILETFLQKNARFITFAIVATIIVYGITNTFFKPNLLAWGEFPYFQNTFERRGFYPRGIHGTKYYFYGMYDLYRYWDSVSKTLAVVLISILSAAGVRCTLSKKLDAEVWRIKGPIFISMLVYLVLMLLTETFYDRYILPVIPMGILLLATKPTLLKKLLLMGFVAGLGFFSYQFSNDFVLTNQYVWTKSLTLVDKKVFATNAWKNMYPVLYRDYDYLFSFDSPDVNPEIKSCYAEMEKHKIQYPFNFFVNPYVYFYEYNSNKCPR